MHPLAKSSAVRLYAPSRPTDEQRVLHFSRVLRAASLLHQAAGQPGKAVFMTSLGAEDMVITDLIANHELPIELVTLDTGKLHAETLALIPRIAERYGLQVRRVHPAAKDAAHFVGLHGDLGMRTSVEHRKSCCAIRKVEPLRRALAGSTAWVTGMRREQSPERADVPVLSFDASTGRTKYSPLAEWSWADVWRYIELNDVPYNPLHDAFFPSIGCEPCTRAVWLGEDMRSGRWWWEEPAPKECGLHVAVVAQADPLMEHKP
jgi:phosphoadenosine phosphosulfate reductase